MKKNLMNISQESMQLEEGSVILSEQAIVIPAPEPVEFVQQQDTDGDLERLRIIADSISGMMPDTLGARVANIGIAITGGADAMEISNEAFDAASIGRAAMGIIKKILDFLRALATRAIAWLENAWRQHRHNRGAAVKLQKEANLFADKYPMTNLRFKTDGLAMLKYNGEFAKLASDLAGNFKAYTRDVHGPYMKWVDETIAIAEKVQGILDKIARDGLMSESDANFTELEKITLVAPPSGWGNSLWNSGISPSFSPKGPTWGNATIRTIGDANTRLIALESEDANFIRAEESPAEVIELNSTMLIAYAFMNTGVVDLLVGMTKPADRLADMFKKLHKVNLVIGSKMNAASDSNPDIYSEMMRRVEIVGRTATGMEVISRQTIEYFQYLSQLRDVLTATVSMGITAGQPEGAK